MSKHRVVNKVSYPDGKGGEKHAAPGSVVDDLPEQSVKWLVDQGHVERVPSNTKLRKGWTAKELEAGAVGDVADDDDGVVG